MTAAGRRIGLTQQTSVSRIGLTGGIGSGKSTVARALVACGAHLVDTDAIARALTLPGGAGIGPIALAFGAEMVDAEGALDRDRMRACVFADPTAKRRLEVILHPLIGQQAQLQAEQADGRVVVFDVPLLTESRHWRQRVDRVLVVDCPEEVQVTRVMQRSGWTEAAVRAVIAQQAARPARRAIADAVLHNHGVDEAALASQVQALWAAWTGSGPAADSRADYVPTATRE